jgi:hypothetical protein
MMGRMNKHINRLSMRDLLGVERKEHGLKEPQTMAQQRQMEKKEHNLKGTPSTAKVMAAESAEHYPGMGGISVKGTAASRQKATAIYKGKAK